MKRRVALEAYLTSPTLALRCIKEVESRFPFAEFDLIIEPSAGNGAFFDQLPNENRIGIDLQPSRSDFVESDFLDWRPPTGKRILVLGNPPYGQRASLAVKFLQHAATFAEVIAFILPRSFNKETFQRRIPREFHLVHSFDCDEPFDYQGGKRIVKTVFQIWQRRDTLRPVIVRASSHPHFEMRHAHLSRVNPAQLDEIRRNFEFAIPQVGSFEPRDSATLTKGSHWFIRPISPNVRVLFDQLDFSFLAGMNTAHASLAKADVVQAYETALSMNPELAKRIEIENLTMLAP